MLAEGKDYEIIEIMIEGEKIKHIEKLQIPDEDMIEWIKSLREGSFTDEEMDAMLSKLNLAYADHSMSVDQRVEEIEKYYNARGIKVTESEKGRLRKNWEKRMKQS